jgi:hypothetical protein
VTLKSRLFKDDQRLQSCLVSDPAHVQKGDSGDYVARIQQALQILMEDDGIDIDDGELKSKQYGQSTTDAVQQFKDDREIINISYQKSADNIVGKMTIARLEKEILEREKADAPEFIDLTKTQINVIKADLVRSRQMVDIVLRRLRSIAHITPSGGLLVTPRNLAMYDTKVRILNVFRINTFEADDFPVPADILATLRSRFRGLNLPGPGNPLVDGLQFASLLENFSKIRRGLDENFPKQFWPAGTFKGSSIGFFAAFVDASDPTDPTVRFKLRYFDPDDVDADARAVTLAHERAHTLLRANGHPGTGDQPFCVAPHLGDPNVTTSEQALANPYCYEWLIYSMQPDYNAGKHRGPECGT